MKNSKVEEIFEKQVLTVAKAVERKLDDEIIALDRFDDDDLEAIRERCLQQMKRLAEKRSRCISFGHGEYSEIHSEKDFFPAVKASDRVVCHFYRENWPCKDELRKCIVDESPFSQVHIVSLQVMDQHLSILAKQHVETRFVKIQAEKSPFLADRLKIVVGFDQLGGTGEFTTEELEERLAKSSSYLSRG